MTDAATSPDAAAKLVIAFVRGAIADETAAAAITPETPLIGGEAALSSMKLVELCVALEDAAIDQGFEFDWTSEAAMSRLKSMFRSVQALADEYARQSTQAA